MRSTETRWSHIAGMSSTPPTRLGGAQKVSCEVTHDDEQDDDDKDKHKHIIIIRQCTLEILFQKASPFPELQFNSSNDSVICWVIPYVQQSFQL